MSKNRWLKKDILPEINSNKYKELLNELEKNVKFVEKYRRKLIPSISVKEFMRIIKVKEKIAEIISRLSCYGYLWFSEDTSNQEAKGYMSNIEQLCVNLGNRIMFFSLWFKSLDERNANRIINSVPEDYKYYLKYMRLLKPHTLTEPEEKILNIKDTTGISALVKLYDIITNGFVFNFKKKQLTREELSTYVKDPNSKIRKAAYQELYRVYAKHSDVLNEIYRNIIIDWKNESINLRKYASPISVRNKSNDISDKAVSTLLEVCRKNRKIFQEYFKLKSKICKIKNMTRYDIYAPYKDKNKKYSYEEAKKFVLNAYNDYSYNMYSLAEKVIDDKHIDNEIRKNKMSGGFCLDIAPGVTPYIMLNFTGEVRDVFTIAHELGHAVHAMLAHKHSILTSHPPLILAETASVFGEMLLFDNFIKNVKDKDTKVSMLLNKLDDTYATIIRQSYFVIFEIKAHDMFAKGASLSEINNAYLINLKEQFGDSVKIPEEFKYEWPSIPHFYHSPFYCYSYVFGNLLVLSLYERYKKEGKPFVEKYIKILSYGDSEKPATILKEVGVDIEAEKIWQSGFDLIKEMLDELKELT